LKTNDYVQISLLLLLLIVALTKQQRSKRY